MQHVAAKRFFREELSRYASATQGIDSYLIPPILMWFKKKRFVRKPAICEFGGGAGQLLATIAKAYPRARFVDAEIVPEYRKHLASKKIEFRISSVLNSRFASHSLDVLLIRDVLHHLVGRNYKESLQNQQKALVELKRLVRPGGAIFIEEITNGSELITKLLYYLTKLNGILGVKIPSMFVSPHGHISFFTPRRLRTLIRQVFGGSYRYSFALHRVQAGFASRLAHFFQPIQKAVICIETQK